MYRAVLLTALFAISGLFIKLEAADGIWVTRQFARDEESIREVLEFCRDNGIEDVYFQIRGRGDAFYRSRFLSMNAGVQPRDFDPLDYICSSAPEYGVRVHAWFNTYILYSNHEDEPSMDHVYNLFPEWTSMDRFGIRDSELRLNRQRNRFFEGSYLSPVHPKVNQYLYILVREILENYPVDGIHFDYIRFQNRDYGFNPEAREIFRQQTGVDPSWYMEDGNPGQRKIPEKQFFDMYDAYRTEAVNELLIRIRRYVNSRIDPPLISAAVKPSIQEARTRFFQDWPRWLNEGWVDRVVIMNYHDQPEFMENLRTIRQSLDPETAGRVDCGIGLWRLHPAVSERQIRDARELGFQNIVYFSYTTFREDPLYRNFLSE